MQLNQRWSKERLCTLVAPGLPTPFIERPGTLRRLRALGVRPRPSRSSGESPGLMQSSGREVVASATAHVASVFGCAASSFVGRARVPATRTYVYAVLGAYHEDDVRTNCPISLSKWRFPPIPQSVTFLPAGSASSRVLSGPTDAEAEHEFPTNSGALVELPTSLC